jgi:hypothetical protein
MIKRSTTKSTFQVPSKRDAGQNKTNKSEDGENIVGGLHCPGPTEVSFVSLVDDVEAASLYMFDNDFWTTCWRTSKWPKSLELAAEVGASIAYYAYSSVVTRGQCFHKESCTCAK